MGRHAQQSAEGVVRLAQRDLERRDGRPSLFQDRASLVDIEHCHLIDADSLLLLDEGQDVRLNLDVGASDLDALLRDAILRIIGGHVGQQRHQAIIVVFHRRIQAGIGRLDAATEAAPEIHLPAQVESGQIEVGGFSVDRAVGIGSSRLLRLREEVAGRDPLLRPGLQDARAHDSQSQVLIVSRANQGVERRILEHRPPILQVAFLHVGISRLNPFLGHGAGGLQ